MKTKDASKLLAGILPAILVSLILACFLNLQKASALQSVPYKMNFQGRVTNASGNSLANGNYNMKFRIYDALTGGVLLWSEQRANSASTGVAVVNGLFSVQLGDVTSLPVGIFTNQNLYFEIELPTPATATCTGASCESYTEGAMGPRNKLGSSAYAFNSDTLDGLDSTAFATATGGAGYIQNQSGVQQSAASYWISGSGRADTAFVTPNLRPTTDGTTALRIQNASGASTLLTADTSNMQVVIGSNLNGVTFSSNGVLYTGTARSTALVTLSPEYPGAVFTPDGTNNEGNLMSDFCSGSGLLNINDIMGLCPNPMDSYNYYYWQSGESAVNDYDIYIHYRIPNDYDTGSMSNLSIYGRSQLSIGEVKVSLLTKTSGTPCSTSGNAAADTNNQWTQANIVSPLGSCSINPGDMVIFRVHLVSVFDDSPVLASDISFSYKRKN